MKKYGTDLIKTDALAASMLTSWRAAIIVLNMCFSHLKPDKRDLRDRMIYEDVLTWM